MNCPRCDTRFNRDQDQRCPVCRWNENDQMRPSILDNLIDKKSIHPSSDDCKREAETTWLQKEHGDEWHCSCGRTFHYYLEQPDCARIVEGPWDGSSPDWMDTVVTSTDNFANAWRQFLQDSHPDFTARRIEKLIERLRG